MHGQEEQGRHEIKQQQQQQQQQLWQPPNMASTTNDEATGTIAPEGAVEELVASLTIEDQSNGAVNVRDQGKTTPDTRQSDDLRQSASDEGESKDADPVAATTTTAENSSSLSSWSSSKPGMEPALVDALRNPRDRTFISKHERDFEERIKDKDCQQWELPLMNTYQRLLVSVQSSLLILSPSEGHN